VGPALGPSRQADGRIWRGGRNMYIVSSLVATPQLCFNNNCNKIEWRRSSKDELVEVEMWVIRSPESTQFCWFCVSRICLSWRMAYLQGRSSYIPDSSSSSELRQGQVGCLKAAVQPQDLLWMSFEMSDDQLRVSRRGRMSLYCTFHF
jgi:hypothetical protein